MTDRRPWTRRALAGFALAAVPAALGATASATVAPPDESDGTTLAGVRVLLTNDDGVQPDDAAGLFALRSELCAAGADVVVVAPWSQQSGTSASITFGAVFTMTAPSAVPDAEACAAAPSGGAVYGVCLSETACTADAESATPGDVAALGINAVGADLGWTEGPDVALVGINDGGNEGLNIPLSGTIGAAAWADAYGVPAIALSAKSETTAESLAADSAWTVELLSGLIAADALPDGYVLSVNFPSPDLATGAVAWTAAADVAWGGTLYEREGDTFVTSYGECPYDTCGFAPDGSDVAALEAGSISVTPLVVNRTSGLDVDTAGAEEVVAGLGG